MARPREFDPGHALAAIMTAFWENGYEATSLQDLSAATGLSKGSLYAAFGAKRAMYHQALALYASEIMAPAAAQLRQSDVADGRVPIARLLSGIFAGTPSPWRGRGCFLCKTATDQAPADPEARRFVTEGLAVLEQALADSLSRTERFEDDTEARAGKARELVAVYCGLQTLAAGGIAPTLLAAMCLSALDGLGPASGPDADDAVPAPRAVHG